MLSVSDPKTTLRILLTLVALVFVVFWGRALIRRAKGRLAIAADEATIVPRGYELFVGFIADFFDTLGIGSFATTTSIFKFTRMVPDPLIPGTLNAGHTLPTIF